MMKKFLPLLMLAFVACTSPPAYDIIIRNGTLYDGTGNPPVQGDLAIQGDTIVAMGDLGKAKGRYEVDARNLAVAPGFINMLSWSVLSLLEDGRSMGEIKQGVTLQIFGEGHSMGPLSPEMKEEMLSDLSPVLQKQFGGEIPWTTLGEYLQFMERKGVSQNIASFIGATTPREVVLGKANRAPSDEELKKMKALVSEAMEEGALGVGASLIYAPANYASTEELIELCKTASPYGGIYITHMRSEGDHIFDALEETFRIGREAQIPVEIYHLKISHDRNWPKVDSVIARIEAQRAAGFQVTADMYTYTAGGTGLTARIPVWVQEGGIEQMIARLKDKAVRSKVIKEIEAEAPEMNNKPEDVLIVDFKKDSLDQLYKNKRLSEIAAAHGKSPAETVLDLVMADHSRIETIYFLMSEENVKKQLALPFVSLGSDASSIAAEGEFLKEGAHPRAYGNFARFLGRYVRDEKLMSLEEGIRRMTGLPAQNLHLKKRGLLKPGYYGDVVIFDPNTIQDHATFENPHQYATGVLYVFVNGVEVLKSGQHTGKMPGRVVRGTGFKEN